MATTNGVATTYLYDVLTLAEAAAYLKLSEADVRTEAEAGRLVGRAVGDGWRFVRNELVKWVRPARPATGLRPELDETEEEFEAFLAILRANRDELDRATKSGKYAEDE
jgi:excisionase family DNA binding protein